MHRPSFQAFLIALNLALLFAVIQSTRGIRELTDHLASATRRRDKNFAEQISNAASDLAALKVRLDQSLGTLSRLEVPSRSSAQYRDPPADPPPVLANEASPEAEPAESPTPLALSVPLLSSDEFSALLRRKAELPRLNHDVVLHGDLSALLEDASWNPAQRELAPDARNELEKLRSDYKYFARLAPAERYREFVAPEIPQMRERGAFVEFYSKDRPPSIDGVLVSHAEPSGRPGVERLYYFYEEDFPDVYYHRQVSEQRALEAFVKIYDALNEP